MDKLIKWRILNVGDQIFCVRRLDKEVVMTTLEEIHIDDNGIRLKAERFNYLIPQDWLDRTIFLTQEEAEKELIGDNGELPYIKVNSIEIVTEYKYNPNYGDDKICKCGHTYYRHFDPYKDMYAVGCKYCHGDCDGFEEVE